MSTALLSARPVSSVSPRGIDTRPRPVPCGRAPRIAIQLRNLREGERFRMAQADGPGPITYVVCGCHEADHSIYARPAGHFHLVMRFFDRVPVFLEN